MPCSNPEWTLVVITSNKTHKHRKDELGEAQHEPNEVNENNQAVLLRCAYGPRGCTYADLCKFE